MAVRDSFGHWNCDLIAWLALLPRPLLARAWLPNRWKIDVPYRIDTLSWFGCGLENRMLYCPDGAYYVANVSFGLMYDPWRFPQPVALHTYRQMAWKATGAIRGSEPEGVFMNREPGKMRQISNAAEATAVFEQRLRNLRWKLNMPSTDISQRVREARSWRAFVGVEGSNCTPLMAMEEGGVFVELHPCGQGWFGWFAVSRWLGLGFVCVGQPQMGHLPDSTCPHPHPPAVTAVDLALMAKAAERAERFLGE
jgi:hypothetical protein